MVRVLKYNQTVIEQLFRTNFFFGQSMIFSQSFTPK